MINWNDYWFVFTSVFSGACPLLFGSRKTDGELDKYFKDQSPGILGGLLNIMSKALEVLPDISRDKLPRMADFTLLGRAVAVALGNECITFDQCYMDNQKRALEKGLDNCPIYPALINLLDHETQGFYGIYSVLLEKLERHLNYRPNNWPKTAKALAVLIKRQAAALRKVGVLVEFDSDRHSEGFRVAIDKLP